MCAAWIDLCSWGVTQGRSLRLDVQGFRCTGLVTASGQKIIGSGGQMGRAEDRRAARRAVHEAQIERRRERAAREKQLQALAVEVQVTLLDGHAKLRAAEVAAGQTLTIMIEEHGASVRELVEWCCGTLTLRDMARLRGLAEPGNLVGSGCRENQ